ncbi:MAG: HNH endonuclease, partial [Oscillospiraceae bacterium]|nr:HNH endonuclease [Oscillospiraceae bacterium]
MSQDNLMWREPYPSPILSITTTHPQERFRYSPDFSACQSPVYKGTVSIQMVGNYAREFAACNQAAGFSGTPNGYTWHHKYMVPYQGDMCDMQLVDKATHRRTCCHVGGHGQYINEHAQACRMLAAQYRLDDETEAYLNQLPAVSAAPLFMKQQKAFSPQDISAVEQDLQLCLPPILSDFYRQHRSVTPTRSYFTIAGSLYLIS